jgi:choline dehydrogenase-like flavoprotein
MTARRIVVVGSGVAAVTFARGVLQTDKECSVVILEAGGDLRMANPRIWLDFLMTKRRPQDRFADAAGDYDVNSSKMFTLEGSRLLVRGGSTNHWGGWALRMKPEDFELRTLTKQGIDWPITYAELQPWYAQAETALGIAGDTQTDSPPRNGATYPYPAVPYTILDGPVITGLRALGYSYEHLPIARTAACQTTGTCRYCPYDARYAAGSDLDRLTSEFGTRVSVRLGAPVRRVLMSNKEKCEGVEVVDPTTEQTQMEPADVVVIAAGTIESPKILQASTSPYWPDGVGNHSRHLGRHLITHPLLSIKGYLKENSAHLEQEIDFPTLASRHFDTPEQQSEGKMFFVRDGKYVQIAIEDHILGRKERLTAAQIDQRIDQSTQLELRALVEGFPGEGNLVELASGVLTKAGLPRSRIQYLETEKTANARAAHTALLKEILEASNCRDVKDDSPKDSRGDHATSTCRMSRRASDGVVDRDLRVHDTANVFVCSNAVFPNSGAVNPTLTLTALALRLGSHLGMAT